VGGIVAENARLPKVVQGKIYLPNRLVKCWNSGQGTDAVQANGYRKDGYKVTAHEFGDNFVRGVPR